jgi:hypothetical protein
MSVKLNRRQLESPPSSPRFKKNNTSEQLYAVLITQLASLDLNRIDDIFFHWGSSSEATQQILNDIRETKRLVIFEEESRLRREYNTLNRTILTQGAKESYEAFNQRCVELNASLHEKDEELQVFLGKRPMATTSTRGSVTPSNCTVCNCKNGSMNFLG